MLINENKEMRKYWDDELNVESALNRKKLTCGSGRKVVWRCYKCKETFIKTPNQFDTNLKRNEDPCPYCSGKKVKYEESLSCLRSNIVKKYWDFDKNKVLHLDPAELPVLSNKKACFECKEHEERYEQVISDFSSGHIGCKICSGKKASKDNNLEALYPKIASEINREKYYEMYGETIDTKNMLPLSNKIVPFDCNICGETHIKKISSRVNQSTGCSSYNSQLQQSRSEIAVYLYLKNAIEDIQMKYIVSENKMEFDLYSKNLALAIEYDGGWHNNEKARKRDEKKNKYCSENGITLIRLREVKNIKIDITNTVVIYCNYDKDLKYMEDVLKKLKLIIQTRFNIKKGFEDEKKCIMKVCDNLLQKVVYIDTLEKKYPAIYEGIIEEDKKFAQNLKPKSSIKNLRYMCECGKIIEKSPKVLANTKCKCKFCHKYIEDITAEKRVLI